MKPDRKKRYDDPEDYFRLGGSVTMRLTGAAAMEVCQTAAVKGLIVVRVEGGNWHHPGFQPSLACIWDGADPPVTVERAHENNSKAAAFIEEESEEYDVFILTDAPITGYRHKTQGTGEL